MKGKGILRLADKQIVYKKAKQLLNVYRSVVWSTQEKMLEVQDEAQDFGSRSISDLADYLSFDFEGDIDKNRAQSALTNIAENKLLVNLVDKAMVKLKSYPEHGEMYFLILSNQYINRIKSTDAKLIDAMEIERTQYYKRKKEATYIFGVSLWGHILPCENGGKLERVN